MKRLALGLALTLAACGGNVGTSADPYDAYLAANPDPSIVLSREDAQARAFLGCSVKWAPGTIDYVLHEAYKNNVC